MAMTGPGLAIRPGPAGGAALKINQMKLATVTMGVIAEQCLKHLVSIRTLLQSLETADPEIRIGVGLGGNSTNAGADMGNRRTHSEMAGGNGNPKAAVGLIAGNDGKGHSNNCRSNRWRASRSTAAPAQHC